MKMKLQNQIEKQKYLEKIKKKIKKQLTFMSTDGNINKPNALCIKQGGNNHDRKHMDNQGPESSYR